VHRQHEHRDVRRGGHDRPRRLDPVARGHVEVHQDDVGLQLERARDHLIAVGRLACEDDVGDGRQQ
jgi:hypothetical protein